MAGFDSGEASGVEASFLLHVRWEVVELASGEGLAIGVLLLREDADATADGDGRVLVVT